MDEPPFRVRADDSITLRYFPPEHHGEPQERSETFQVAGSSSGRRHRRPRHQAGVSGHHRQARFEDWANLPFPYESWRVRERDKRYWNEYRTTRKRTSAWRRASRLWGTRFGKVTSIRRQRRKTSICPRPPTPTGLRYARHTCRRRRAASSRQRSRPSRLKASEGGAWISPSCSFVQLLSHRGGAAADRPASIGSILDRRASEIGLLLATGYRRSQVRNLLLLEALILSGLGAFVGCGVAILYAGLLVSFLG